MLPKVSTIFQGAHVCVSLPPTTLAGRRNIAQAVDKGHPLLMHNLERCKFGAWLDVSPPHRISASFVCQCCNLWYGLTFKFDIFESPTFIPKMLSSSWVPVHEPTNHPPAQHIIIIWWSRGWGWLWGWCWVLPYVPHREKPESFPPPAHDVQHKFTDCQKADRHQKEFRPDYAHCHIDTLGEGNRRSRGSWLHLSALPLCSGLHLSYGSMPGGGEK